MPFFLAYANIFAVRKVIYLNKNIMFRSVCLNYYHMKTPIKMQASKIKAKTA